MRQRTQQTRIVISAGTYWGASLGRKVWGPVRGVDCQYGEEVRDEKRGNEGEGRREDGLDSRAYR